MLLRSRHYLLCFVAGCSVIAMAAAAAEEPAREHAAVAAAQQIPPITAQAGPLDGLTFEGELGPEGKPKDTADRFVFKDGAFVSKECESRCDYPARPYFVRRVGTAYEFVSETKCPYKDATIVWRGTVEGDRITGVSTWTVKRWYWTVEKNYEFSGTLSADSESLASQP